ncbi:MAG: DUF411 domain-containing protein [Georgfuchsia sp.]
MKLQKHRFLSMLLITLVNASTAWAQSSTQVEVYKSLYCGCCEKWIEHLQHSGFKVSAHKVTDISIVRKSLGMPDRLGSCHTAKIGSYVIEGHVPAADIQRLLKEQPQALGLAVPSMVPGSPGMESAKPVPYETLLVLSDGNTHVFAKH